MQTKRALQVVITNNIPATAAGKLKEAGCHVKQNKAGAVLIGEELAKFCRNADAVISLLSDKFTREIISRLERCRIIANYAVGYNNIDIQAARSRNIVVTNTPDVLTDATADMTMALILSAARHITAGDRFMREGKFTGWKPDLFLGLQLNEAVIGIIGAGRIGRAVAKRAAGFGARIVYYSKNRNMEMEQYFGGRFMPLDELMAASDVITIHTPLNNGSRGMLNKKRLNLLKKTAIIVNTARGEVIDEKYLIEMLKKKRIMAAAFDVYENEPAINNDLLTLDNVVLAPHTGSGTTIARNRMAELAAQNVINVLNGKPPLTPV